jgi:dUTP pyrophosphatase
MIINGRFEKVSREQYIKDFKNLLGNLNLSDDEINKIYDDIKIPRRSTVGSAGYDFYTPIDITLSEDKTNSIKIPTGIRCDFEEDTVLSIYPRSSVGIKKQCRLMNTVGVIDWDYYDADNEGHIIIALELSHNSNNSISAEYKKGDAIAQGIFTEICILNDEISPDEKRTGGIGSTDNK